ncbi:hypothetical protein LY474_01345 [Myxococcus stipitatus]|uniref:hypothetical protein n=1 Tax=Myxococcus stipitatus TaxID=83455 RepID=UPI001F22B115|nr:hypothetical protein [Myxococcus stipitatus]MCE9666444.1 hypothetical protein [Myxococcus stipitatus]
MRRGTLLLGMLLWGAACSLGPMSGEGSTQSSALDDEEERPCEAREEVACIPDDSSGLCPRVEPWQVCTIWISEGIEAVKPPVSCIRRRQWLKFHLEEPVPESILYFEGEGSDLIFVGHPSSKIELSDSAGRTWCGKVRADAKWQDHLFQVSSGLPEGEPGELEVVRDPGEEGE